jgi:sigma-B regulation protein RsbU (phosphoserine phosphatase)
MQAAMSAVFTSGAFAVEERNHASPAETLTRLNKAVYANTRRGHFVTYLLATLDIKAKSLRFANAGQTKPLLISGGAAEWLHGSGINFPLGMVDSAQYQDQTVGLKSGDALVLMTDGFTEAMDRSDQQFGEERMVEIARSADLSKSSAFEIIGRFKRGVRNHMNGATQHDDMTMVVVKVL